MKKFLFLLLYINNLIFFSNAQDQKESISSKVQAYHPTPEKVNNLFHTKLKLRLDLLKKELYGEEWITLQPHFYPTDVLTLDAKAMLIHQVKLVRGQSQSPLKHNYDGRWLKIRLDRKYSKDEKYTLYISYTARPEKVTQQGSRTIKKAKGLYFVNPTGEDPQKPTQVWTQGETESNSVWFPTIDRPNQKTTQEIYITVPDRFVTLSNGLLIEQKKNIDGSRTDYWKMDLLHAPYLFFIGVGEYAVVKDQWEDVPLHYYVEKKYEPYAKDLFGSTPEMMGFFSKITGVRYPWCKYDQIVVRDFVSGAMENTTAVVYDENIYQTIGQLADGNGWEEVIAHELFHHWFGNLVTTESWSNLTLNESFASYAPYLWNEYKYGKDHTEFYRFSNSMKYFWSNTYDKDLVRFCYKSREDLFDDVSYSKGALILHMLRKYLGDEAFFTGMKKYLTDHRFGTAEVHQWRMALEAISGKDLNWFFNQWYFGHGHPKLKFSHNYDDQQQKVSVKIVQTQQTPLFEFPYSIDVYQEDGSKKCYDVWVKKQKENDFSFPSPRAPRLIHPDPDHILLAQIKDEKTLDDDLFLYDCAPRYLDRFMAISKAAKVQLSHPKAVDLLVKALDDPYDDFRILALQSLDLNNLEIRKKALSIVIKRAQNDPKTLVQGWALSKLALLKDKEKYQPLFEKGVQSPSYFVVGTSLSALLDIDPRKAFECSSKLQEQDIPFGPLEEVLLEIFIRKGDEKNLLFVADHIANHHPKIFKKDSIHQMCLNKGFQWVISKNDLPSTQKLVDGFLALFQKHKEMSPDIKEVVLPILQEVLVVKQKLLQDQPDVQSQLDYVKQAIMVSSRCDRARL
ncbi:MAG: M1 family aminopeptidase [Flavobacteriales bacterium AspAUS03]